MCVCARARVCVCVVVVCVCVGRHPGERERVRRLPSCQAAKCQAAKLVAAATAKPSACLHPCKQAAHRHAAACAASLSGT